MTSKLMVEILGDSSSAVSALGKTSSAAKTTEGAVGKTGTSLKGLATAVATGYAVKKVMEFGKESVSVAGASMKANKLLAAEFKNVGDESGKAAKHATDLAESLGRQIGVSPTVIKAAEGILTTFHAVSGEAGMQSGVFDRATKAAADLAAAGFGDMSTNAKQLGKALQDPTKGVTALARSGVNFSAAQKENIKNMQKSGDLLGAQKIVLKEVENQVKGTATATAGSGDKMKVAYEQFQVSIGTALMPAIKMFRGELTGLFGFLSANASWLVPIITAISGFAVALFVVSKSILMFKTAMEGMKAAIAGVKVAWQLLNSSFLMSPIGLIVIGIIAVVAVLVILYLKVDWFRAFVNTAMADIVGFFTAGWNVVVGIFDWVVGVFSQYGNLILFAILGPWFIVFKLVQAAITGGWSGVMAQIGAWAGMISRVLSPILGIITAPFTAAWGVIYSGLISPLSSAFGAVVGAISAALSGVTNAITAPFTAAWHFIDDHVLSPLKSAWNAVANTINAIHVSFTIPSNAITDVLHVAGKGFDWQPPFHIPTLQSGGLVTRTGLILAHAGEAVTPLPSRARGDGPLVRIEHAHFSEKIDVEAFGKRLAWTVETAGV